MKFIQYDNTVFNVENVAWARLTPRQGLNPNDHLEVALVGRNDNIQISGGQARVVWDKLVQLTQ